MLEGFTSSKGDEGEEGERGEDRGSSTGHSEICAYLYAALSTLPLDNEAPSESTVMERER